MTDIRPINCRFRLRDERKPYPRSGCLACGRTITTGLGKECYHTRNRITELEAEIERIKILHQERMELIAHRALTWVNGETLDMPEDTGLWDYMFGGSKDPQ